MKTPSIFIIVVMLFSKSLAQTGQPTVIERGAHHRVWQTTREVTAPDGTILNKSSSYTELGTGMHYEQNGQWIESQAVLEITDRGATANRGQHKVSFPANINAGVIELLSPDGKHFRSRVLGLAYYDPATGRSTLIAELKDSVGELMPPNQLIYRECFTDFKADVRYTYKLGGLEQDVILRQKPPPPEDFGLDRRVRLLVLTEFFEPPEPLNRQAIPGQQQDAANLPAQGDADFNDDFLDFGVMKIVPGRAFSIDAEADPNTTTKLRGSVPVMKSWRKLDNRDFLIESVEYQTLQPQLDTLPDQAAIAPPDKKNVAAKNKVSASLSRLASVFPKGLWPAPDTPVKDRIQLAKATASAQPGVVVDYVTLFTSASTYTFQCDTTYYITNQVNLEATTLEGGSVIKTLPGGHIYLYGPLRCLTDQYRPAIFTSKDDNTVGETITGSTGIPTNACNYAAINLSWSYTDGTKYALTLRHVKFAYMSGVTKWFTNGPPVELWHCQFLNACYGVGEAAGGGVFKLYDVLSDGTFCLVGGESFTLYAEHVTTRGGTYMALANYTSQAYLTNCIFAGTPVPTTVTLNYDSANVKWLASDAGVFQSTGAGALYLPANSAYRNAGTTGINANLAAEIKARTTTPPIILASTITANATLSPQVPRDGDVPDLGYHYAPIDYAANAIINTNIVLTIAPGTVITPIGSYGLAPIDGAQLVSEGHDFNRIHFVRSYAVQEQSVNWGGASINSVATIYPYNYTTSRPTASFRFTDFDGMSYCGYHIYNSNGTKFASLKLQDCTANSGTFYMLHSDGGATPVLSFQNNLFERVQGTVQQAFDLSFYNNLFFGGAWSFFRNSTPSWIIRDNAFDGCSVSDTSTTNITHGYNAYINNSGRLSPTQGTDVVLTNFMYAGVSPRRFYQLSPYLIDKGSRSADQAGLFHHSVRATQEEEGPSTVDIGFHYVAQPATKGTTTVWVDDALPAGATAVGDTDGWNWTNANPAPFSGSLAHQSSLVSGGHQHYFYGASQTLTIAEGDVLFAYVYLDPSNPPTQVLLQWYGADIPGWNHRAHWGPNNLGWSSVPMGPLPATGVWVRLEVPANVVDLVGRTISGMAFTLYGGRATWDRAGKITMPQASLDLGQPASPLASTEQGLVGHWRLDEGSGTAAEDRSGYGHNGVLQNGPTWTTGKIGSGALSFDGSNDYVTNTESSALRLPGDLTVAFWMKKNADAADWVRLIGKGASGVRNYGVWQQYNANSPLLFQQYDGNSGWTFNVFSATTTTTGLWYHVAAVISETNMYFYINGALDVSATRTGSAPTNSDPVTFGYAGYHSYFAGVLDDIRIYNRALASNEVSALAKRVVFVGTDTTTQGNWKGVYGQDGYQVILDATNYPPTVTVTPSGKTDNTWTNSTTDVRALQRGGADRIAASWYSGTNFDIAVTQNDGVPHRIALYCLDWDTTTRSQTFDIKDSVSGTVLDSRSITNFDAGKYLVWDIVGDVTIRITNTGPSNAVLSGIFFGTPNGVLYDSDGDGLPDYFEDRNGNGVYDSGVAGETDWRTSNNAISSPATALQVFTPLK